MEDGPDLRTQRLLVLAKVADQTHSRIFEIQQGGGGPCSRSPPISGGAKPGRSHHRNPGRRSDPHRVARRRGQPQNGTLRLARFPIGIRSHSALTLRIAIRATPASQPHPQSVIKHFTSAVPHHFQGTGYAPRRCVRQRSGNRKRPRRSFRSLLWQSFVFRRV